MTIMLEQECYLMSKLTFLSLLPKKSILKSVCKNLQTVGCQGRGREVTSGAMSLRYADMSLPDLLGRPSLPYAAMSMRNTSKFACVIQEVF